MTTLIWIVSLAVVVGGVIWAVRRWKGVTETRVITCPETGEREAVEVDPVHRLSHAVAGRDDLRLHRCTRWPERQDCDQACLTQIAAAPDGCRVHGILDVFYAGQVCASCGRALGHSSDWAQHVPGLLLGDGTVTPWTDVPAQQLEAALATAKPTCWDCTQIARVYQEHPELVTERPGRKWEAAS